jgi:hypothetical protein
MFWQISWKRATCKIEKETGDNIKKDLRETSYENDDGSNFFRIESKNFGISGVETLSYTTRVTLEYKAILISSREETCG